MGRGVVRLRRDGPLVGRPRLGVPAALAQHVAQVAVRLGESRPQADGLAATGQRVLELVVFTKELAEVAVGLRQQPLLR